MSKALFPQKPNINPTIYAYSEPQYEGLLKVGFTAHDVETRVRQQHPTMPPNGKKPYKIEFVETALFNDGGSFTDHLVHKVLEERGCRRLEGKKGKKSEWFECTVSDVRAAMIAIKTHSLNLENRTRDFPMRPEQKDAVDKTFKYFKSIEREKNRIPKFLWNCKMRFGKTFATYQLAKKLECKRILVLTFKPAVVSAWKEDLLTHIAFEDWQFISKDTELTYEKAVKDKPIVCFGSFQDFLQTDKTTGGIKPRNEWVHEINWDLVVFDEYHFGAWKGSAKKLFEQEDEEDLDSFDLSEYDRGNAYDESFLPITTSRYLYLSGTPFKALNSGEFIEEQIYSWTYSDEQEAKELWKGKNNPYESLPRMVLMTYKVPEEIMQIAMCGENDEFDLNAFFSTEVVNGKPKFIHTEYVQKWLNLIRGAYTQQIIDDLKQAKHKPALPYSDSRLVNALLHTVWFLPNIASCQAMYDLLMERVNSFYHDYKINLCAGAKAGVGADALPPVLESMANPLHSKSITLTCGKLTTGVTVRPWTGIFMLRNLSSPETYFQAAFRVQSPWVVDSDDKYQETTHKEIVKQECYVFDFAINRALQQVAEYGTKLTPKNSNPEIGVGEFIKFLPVIAFDGSTMKEIDASGVLEYAMSGTSATLLARRWESALLVNVDNDTLRRLLANPAAMAALMKIESFRNLNSDIEIIINKSEKVKNAKKSGKKPTKKQKKELTEAEKEYKSKRKMIQEKLIKFATRIPIFMYLTDFREECLKDVIRRLESDLFKKVTSLEVKDFELLLSLGLFNDSLMNDAVYKFRRYEDASLVYTGINRHELENRGGWDTVITQEEFKEFYK